MNALEIAKMASQFQREHRTAQKTAKTPRRVKIIAGRYAVGDSLNGSKISGLGKTWSETVSDEDSCVYGLTPGQPNIVTFQYAYLEG